MSVITIQIMQQCQENTLLALTHWGRVTHICVGESTIIGSDNGLAPDRRQAIIWTNAGILLIGPLGTYFSGILTGIQAFSFTKMHSKMSSAKWRPFCLGLNVLIHWKKKQDYVGIQWILILMVPRHSGEVDAEYCLCILSDNKPRYWHSLFLCGRCHGWRTIDGMPLVEYNVMSY